MEAKTIHFIATSARSAFFFLSFTGFHGSSKPTPEQHPFSISPVTVRCSALSIDERSPMNNSTWNWTDRCWMYPIPFVRAQYYLVFVFGTSVASLSIIQNIFLLYLFLTRLYFRHSYFLYFSVLAAFDVFHSIAYIAVFSICVFFEYWQDTALMRVWYKFVLFAVTAANVVGTASTYLLVAASSERYLYANGISGFCTNHGRALCLIGEKTCHRIFDF